MIRGDVTTAKYHHAGLLHRPSCSGLQCSQIKPSLSDINAAIDAGEVPLVQVHLEARSGTLIRLSIHRCTESKPLEYVTISHVWRHGLGSTSEAGLWQCQLHALWRILCMSRLYDNRQANDELVSPLFWIDSLCIPASPKHRKVAIESINAVFRNSSEVLVVDLNLLSLNVRSVNQETALAAFICCAWQTRYVTFCNFLLM